MNLYTQDLPHTEWAVLILLTVAMQDYAADMSNFKVR
jgi:hypothetical protein